MDKLTDEDICRYMEKNSAFYCSMEKLADNELSVILKYLTPNKHRENFNEVIMELDYLCQIYDLHLNGQNSEYHNKDIKFIEFVILFTYDPQEYILNELIISKYMKNGSN